MMVEEVSRLLSACLNKQLAQAKTNMPSEVVRKLTYTIFNTSF